MNIKSVSRAKAVYLAAITTGLLSRLSSNHINNGIQNFSKSIKYNREDSKDNSDILMEELKKMSTTNNVKILHNKNFKLGLSTEELKKRTHKDYLTTKKMLASDAEEYLNLKEGDKEALKHLVKAAAVLDKVEMQIDNHYNLAFKEYLEKEIAKGNEDAKLTKILFDAQKGVCALDRDSHMIELAAANGKVVKRLPGEGLYPEDLTKEEFHRILIKMLNEGKSEEVRKILNQRSVVLRNGDELKAIDYVDYFK